MSYVPQATISNSQYMSEVSGSAATDAHWHGTVLKMQPMSAWQKTAEWVLIFYLVQ